MVAGASLILPVFNICLSLAGLTGIGGGALISRLLGEEREDEAKKVSSFSIYLSIAVTAVFAIVMFTFMKPVLELLGASDNTYHYARQYAFCVIVLGGIPTVLSNVMSNLIRSVGMSKEAGFGEGNKSLFLGVMRWAVFNIPMLFLLSHIIGMYGIVWSQVCADILTVLLSFYVYRRYTHTVLIGENV